MLRCATSCNLLLLVLNVELLFSKLNTLFSRLWQLVLIDPVQITRGIEKTAKALVEELRKLSKDVEDSELADVAAVSAGNNYEIGNMIAEAMSKVGRKGVVTLEEGRSSENFLYVVEGMQFDRGYISPYFVTDSEKMSVEYENCKVTWEI